VASWSATTSIVATVTSVARRVSEAWDKFTQHELFWRRGRRVGDYDPERDPNP
jgi:hypothetical protein